MRRHRRKSSPLSLVAVVMRKVEVEQQQQQQLSARLSVHRSKAL
jgi:hypothetical protein